MTLDLYLCLLAVVMRRYKVRNWISKLARMDAERNVEHGPYCQCDGCKDEPNEMMRWCLIDPATLPEPLTAGGPTGPAGSTTTKLKPGGLTDDPDHTHR